MYWKWGEEIWPQYRYDLMMWPGVVWLPLIDDYWSDLGGIQPKLIVKSNEDPIVDVTQCETCGNVMTIVCDIDESVLCETKSSSDDPEVIPYYTEKLLMTVWPGIEAGA